MTLKQSDPDRLDAHRRGKSCDNMQSSSAVRQADVPSSAAAERAIAETLDVPTPTFKGSVEA
jgi:hypothetical protein